MSGYLVGSECYPNSEQALGAYWREMGAEWGFAQSGQPYQVAVYYAVMPDVYPPVFLRVELLPDGTEYGSSYQTVPVIGLPGCDVAAQGVESGALAGYLVGGVAWALAFAIGIGWALRGRHGY